MQPRDNRSNNSELLFKGQVHNGFLLSISDFRLQIRDDWGEAFEIFGTNFRITAQISGLFASSSSLIALEGMLSSLRSNAAPFVIDRHTRVSYSDSTLELLCMSNCCVHCAFRSGTPAGTQIWDGNSPARHSWRDPSLRESEMCFSCLFPIQMKNEKASAVWEEMHQEVLKHVFVPF